MRRLTCLTALLFLSLVSGVTSAKADFITFANRPAWSAAVGTFTTETFETTPLQTVPVAGGTINTGLLSLIISPNHGGIGIISFGGGRQFMGDVHGPLAGAPQFNIISFPQPITAFAADFAVVGEGGINNLMILGTSFMLPNGTTFFGVISDVPFTQVELRTTGFITEFYRMDNVSFGNPIPEPATLLLLGTGLAGVGTAVRKKRKAQKSEDG